MALSISPFPPPSPHQTEVQQPSAGGAKEEQNAQPSARELVNEPAAEDGQSKRSPRVSGNSEAAHLDPSTPEYRELQELKTRDREVRAHEMAHLAAAGPYASGGPSFDYERGADGRRYAVGGHVNIDSSPVPGDPQATLRKAEAVRRAALAPTEPSPQDRRVAADAAAIVTEARMAIASEQREDLTTRSKIGTRGGEDEYPGDAKETPVTNAPPTAVRGSIIARLSASGAMPQDSSVGSRIDTHA